LFNVTDVTVLVLLVSSLLILLSILLYLLRFLRRSVVVREPIDPTPNHEPGTSISTCSWPGYCEGFGIYRRTSKDKTETGRMRRCKAQVRGREREIEA